MSQLTYSDGVIPAQATVRSLIRKSTPSNGNGNAPDRTHTLHIAWKTAGLPEAVVAALPKSMSLSEIDLGKMLNSVNMSSVSNLATLLQPGSDAATLFVEIHKRTVGKEYVNYAGKTFVWKPSEKRVEGETVYVPELAPICLSLASSTKQAFAEAAIASEVAMLNETAKAEKEAREKANKERMQAKMLALIAGTPEPEDDEDDDDKGDEKVDDDDNDTTLTNLMTPHGGNKRANRTKGIK